MSTENIIKYLNSFVNRSENVKELLRMYINSTESRAGAIFIQQGCSHKHICIEHISIDHPNAIVKFKPIVPIENITISTKSRNYISPYIINNIITIPITVYNDYIGVVCIVNRDSEYKEEMVDKMSTYISVTQLVLSKQKIINDYKTRCDINMSTSKDLFLANMSHEIRTPLNGVIGYNQLLMQTNLTSTQQGYLNSMNQCSIQLMQIINDVLDFSKLSSGKMGVNTECFTPQEVIEAVHGAMGQLINEKKQKIKFVIGNEVPEFIIMDKQKLIQILVNIVSNAHKFTDIGGYIELIFNVVNDGFIQVVVKDNGIGISEQDQCKLFSAFEQIQSSIYKTGTGLGLAICDKLCYLLGGDVTVKSTLGLGSTFVINARYKPYEEKIMKRDGKLLKNKIVLVVDDNADNRILLSELLFEWGMMPIVCASALEALRMILGNRYKFSLGLIDICMPGTSGSELAKQIKEERPFFPLIALSSIDSFVTSAEFEQRLDKPIKKVQLFNCIHKILSKRSAPNAFIGDCDSDYSGSDTSSPSSKFNKNSKILIVEDILYNRTLLENMLQLLKYNHVNSAENGKIAFEMLQESLENGEPYDIILLDLRMPVMDGYEVIEAIKSNGWMLPKIIVVTASVLEEDRNKCKNLNIQYFISKPIELRQLKNVMLHVTELL